MRKPILAASLLALAALALPGTALAQATTALVNFDPPGTPQGPSIFVAVPGPQTMDTAPAVFSGGVVLGLATFFPAIQFATGPNVYGTADFGNGLAKTLTIDIKPGFLTTEVSFVLFNGETFNQSYLVRAYQGGSVVASQTLANILPNFNSGYALVDVQSLSGITSVTIDAINPPGAWDFLIDTVSFNQNITNVIPVPAPPVYNPSVPAPITLQAVDGHQRRKRKGKDGKDEVVDVTLQSVLIDFGDDSSNVRGNFVQLTSPVPEPSGGALLLVGLAALGLKARRQHQAVRG